MTKLTIGLILGSTREGRFCEQVADWIENLARERAEFDVERIDLRDYPMPFFDEAAPPLFAPSQNEHSQRWQKKLATLDGFIFTAAEYNQGPTAVVKNALDYAYGEWNNKPAAFVGYGGVGGARSVEQLRQYAIGLQMAPIRNAVHILFPDFMAVNSGEKSLDQLEHLNQSASDMFDQFTWWANALKAARQEDQAKAA